MPTAAEGRLHRSFPGSFKGFSQLGAMLESSLHKPEERRETSGLLPPGSIRVGVAGGTAGDAEGVTSDTGGGSHLRWSPSDNSDNSHSSDSRGARGGVEAEGMGAEAERCATQMGRSSGRAGGGGEGEGHRWVEEVDQAQQMYIEAHPAAHQQQLMGQRQQQQQPVSPSGRSLGGSPAHVGQQQQHEQQHQHQHQGRHSVQQHSKHDTGKAQQEHNSRHHHQHQQQQDVPRKQRRQRQQHQQQLTRAQHQELELQRHYGMEPAAAAYVRKLLPRGMAKYWLQRYSLFSKFDEGAQLDVQVGEGAVYGPGFWGGTVKGLGRVPF